ncbi:efflux RND transporter periplasmic adaptor subunit [Rhodocytophaga aerolata]|uniref:Efflux RND transporter periplasmic adaptor subunit n=1 Tax=Rhodocytophaga aerolata TaxID=455078 RepID=A0ABT8RAR8_9BACT|nr:efflux RND transporter periplasmic adaptor subunit [Rhodocytophaga aerolata]MDO1447805.1 efflux RND transporter periplasmic adaptor subunit [Rhodocytophaga aerolata]
MNKSVKRGLIVVVIVVGVLIIALPRMDFLKADNKTDPKGQAATGAGASAGGKGGPGAGNVAVDVIVVKSEKLDNKIQSTGTILANEEVELRSEISGKVSRIFFKEGDRVKKGQVLVRINDEEQQAQLKRLQYNIKLNEDQEFRQKRLLEKEAISQQEYDISLTQLNTIRAELQQLDAVIDKYSIRAPFSGIIGLRYISEGSYVSPTSQIAFMQDIDKVKVEFSISEKYAAQVKPGSKIAFSITGRDKQYEGTVYAVEPKIDLATRSVRIRAISPNPDGELFPGAFARVELTLETIDNAIMIPTEALIPELQGQKVFLYKNGRAISSPVETGLRTERAIQITKGVQSNDSLIVTGLLQLKDSTQVKVRDLSAAEAAKNNQISSISE